MARNRRETTRQRKTLDRSDGVGESSNPALEESGSDGHGSGERRVLGQTWSAGDTLALFLVTLGAGILRLFRVADPKGFVFDEVYYAKDACKYALGAIGTCRFEGVQNEVHPPIGKWLVSLGIKVFGFDETGFRIMVVVGGTLTVALLYLLGRALLDSTLGASLAAALLAIDPLHFVQSRTSMLDVFVPMFGVAAFLFLVYDRNSLIRSAKGVREGLFRRPWRLAAGAAAGGALTTKWSGVSVLGAVVVLSFVWEWSARTRVEQKRGGPVLGTIRQEVPSIVLYCFVVPIAIYVVSYTGVQDITGLNEEPKRIEGDVLALPWTEGSWGHAFWTEQSYNWNFHSQLNSTHLYQSPGWSWILLKRPVSYFFETDAAGNYREIIATGSPFVWWASIPALLYLAFNWVRRGGLSRPEGLILAGFFFSYGPWLLPMNRPAIFIFYFVGTLPFMMLALGYVAVQIGRSWEARAAVALFSVVAVGFFAFYYPLLTKRPLSPDDWDRRLLFFQDCDKPEGKQITETITKTVGGKEVPTTSISDSSDDEPPPGWCWI